MSHLSLWFSHSKKVEKQQMEANQKRLKPKLDRRNAMKNIDYEASATSSSSEDSSSLRTRSLDLHPYSDRTSFRIRGIDGEIDRICWSLGLSGPEDLAISTVAWEASKFSSSSHIASRSRLNQLNSNNDLGKPIEENVDEGLLTRFGATVRVRDELVNENDTLVDSSKCRNLLPVGSCSGGGGGIKGVRPPVLAPPPSIFLPVLDDVGSNWDIVRDFGPEDNNRGFSSKARIDTSASDEDDVDEISGTIVEREDVDGVRLGETVVLSESCSYSASNNADSSSTNTDPIYIISPKVRFKREINSWTKGSLLGSGSFGTVYEALSDDGFFFAVKEVSLLDQGSQGKQSIHQLEQEIALLSQFEHENIVQYLGTDKNEARLYIFLELVTKGSLAQLYKKYHLQDSQVSTYTRQILHGLTYLHDRNVVHRDIKCANILVDANGFVKLADFGLAKAARLNDVKSCKGTAFWMAPEVVNRKNHGYGLAADIWSLGCTVLEMLTRRLPYSNLEWMEALFMIGNGEPPPVPNSLSRDARDFILQCLQVEPNNRPSAAQLLDHPFVKRPLPTSSGSLSPFHNNWRRP